MVDDSEVAWVQEGSTIVQLPSLSDGYSGAHPVNLAGNIAVYSQPAVEGQIHAVLWRRQ